MRTWENPADFFDVDDFADKAVLTVGTKRYNVTGILRAEYYGAAAGAVEIESSRPVFTLPDAELHGASEGDGIKVLGENYTIVDLEPDGSGVTRLTMVKD